MNYTLDNRRFTPQYNGRVEYEVVVVGCGGTGGWVAESLCRVLPQEAHLILVDYDRVEVPNLLRQNFTRADLDQFKSECLAKRLSSKYDRAIGYSTLPFNFETRGIIVGCVDNGAARRDIASIIKTCLRRVVGRRRQRRELRSGSHRKQQRTLSLPQQCFPYSAIANHTATGPIGSGEKGGASV